MALLRTALPVVAVIAFAGTTIAILATAGSTLGYDYRAYVGAAQRALDGAPLYDPSVDVAGGFAIFLYPPPFALALVPFALLPADLGLWLWQGLAIAAFLAGVAILPVRPTVRWGVLLLGAVDWPLLFALKLGQVGPLLFLLFAIGWRWRDRAVPLGLSIAAGAMVKVQPLILLVWAGLTGRWRAAATAVGAILVGALVSTLVFGPDVWSGYLALLGRVNSPVTTPHNFTIGAIAFQAGLSEAAAASLQVLVVVAVVAIVLIAIRTASAEVSYLTTVVASQILSPLLWDHYAVILLLPTAWLLERGRWWAVAIPLLTSLPLVGVVPSAVYPVVFAIGLVGPLLVEASDRRHSTGQAASVPVGLT
jgi:alpha-1,2-mannosyltransferase